VEHQSHASILTGWLLPPAAGWQHDWQHDWKVDWNFIKTSVETEMSMRNGTDLQGKHPHNTCWCCSTYNNTTNKHSHTNVSFHFNTQRLSIAGNTRNSFEPHRSNNDNNQPTNPIISQEIHKLLHILQLHITHTHTKRLSILWIDEENIHAAHVNTSGTL